MEEKKYIFCINCGEKLVATAKFCNACGTRVAQTAQPTAPKKVEEAPVMPPPIVTPPPVQAPVTPPPVKENITPPPIPNPVASEPAPQKARETVYDGEIHKCPSCGEVIPSFVTNCPACGFELNRKKVSASLQKFIDRVDECDKKIAACPESKTGWAAWNKTKRTWWVILNLFFLCIPLVIYLVWPLIRINSTPKLTAEERQLASVVENFPFPNDRESILAALVYAKEKIDFISKEKIDRKSAYWMRLWCAKAEQLKQKADMMFPNDPIVKESYNEILADDARVKKIIKIKGIVGLVILAIVIIFAIFRYGVLDRVGVTGGTDYSATFEWQNYGLFMQVPEPDTNNGKIVRESTDQIHIELYHISTEDFNNYVKECKNAGFTVDITKTDQVFYAHDDEGYDLSIFFHEDKKTMDIYVDSYDIADEEKQSNTSNTEEANATTESKTEANDSVVSQDAIQQFIDGYEKAEFSKFDSSEEGTEFADSRIYLYCTLDKTEILEADGTTSILGYVTDDANNKWLIQLHFVPAVSKTSFDGYVGKELILRGVYSGYSGTRNIPVVVLDEMIVLGTGENILGMQKLLDD